MHSIIYSHQAQQDLEEMLDYISNGSLANALAYLERYEKKIELLALNPQMGGRELFSICLNQIILC